jgi:hypothetical protein
MSTWHVAPSMLEAYAQDRVDVAVGYSVEAHLEACESCRRNVAHFVDTTRLDRIWDGVTSSVTAPQAGLIERGLTLLGVKDHIARLLAATPALRGSWMLAIAVVLLVAVGTAYRSEHGFVLFLLLAPLLPVAGVAASFGPGIDPTYEIGIAAPMRSFRLLLIRTVAVVSVTTIAAGLAALLLPVHWAVAAWLLPTLGLVMATLALSTLLTPLHAAAVVTLGWVAVGGAGLWRLWERLATPREVFGEPMQSLFLVVILTSAVLLTARRSQFERGERL